MCIEVFTATTFDSYIVSILEIWPFIMPAKS